jgi:trehalose 6-phosphate synthase/phosphatase
MQKLVNVSNRLPVTFGKTISKSSGGLVSALKGFQQDYDFKWVGWSGGHVVDAARRSDTDRRKKVAEELKQRFNYFPIFLDKEDVEQYYTGFSNTSLWPLLHYLPSYAQYDRRWFDAYRKVNTLFADTVAQVADNGSLVWVHDYHLMLLPEMIRWRRPDLKIGFFLHTPFPSYEIFRCHPNRRELLKGLLGADLIGFHTSDYLRHFRSAVLRVLGLESEINTISVDNHSVTISVYPISIPTEKFLKEMKTETYRTCLEQYRRTYAKKKVVLSVERLDYTKGVPRRLEAFERFLRQTKRQDVVFIFINVPSRENVEAYQALREEIELNVGKINGEFATIENVPLHFIHQSVSFSELCALYTLADVATVTPLMDGMNLVAKEYLVCQQQTSGVLILSEFAGAAQELPDASLVNPYDVDEMAHVLTEALEMSEEEKIKRLTPMRERVLRFNASRWGHSFIEDLSITGQQPHESEKAQELNTSILRKFLQQPRTALFLGYDGTLTELQKQPKKAAPDHQLKELFELMTVHSQFDIYIIAGRTREEMDNWFGAYGFHLIAEDGFFIKNQSSGQWTQLDLQVDLSWKSQVYSILQHYTDMTPGSMIEEKSASLVWHYRQVEPEFGAWKAHQMVPELRDLLSNFPVTINHAGKRVEVASMMINKGMAMQQIRNNAPYDYVLCAGDDITDEIMFRSASENDLSIKVGPGDTSARFRVSSPTEFRRLLADIFFNNA